MDLLSSNDDANSKLHTTTTSFHVLSFGNYTILPSAVQLWEAKLNTDTSTTDKKNA
jgi:hypothetical protein